MKKRILSVILTTVLAFSVLPPITAIAAEDTEAAVTSAENTDMIGISAKMVGSNGIAYDNVVYLSEKTYSSLPEDMQDAYVEICDDITSLKENGIEITDAVVSVNKDSELEACISLPAKSLYTEPIQPSPAEESIFAGEEPETAPAENPTNDQPAVSAPADTENSTETTETEQTEASADAETEESAGDIASDEAAADTAAESTPDEEITEETTTENSDAVSDENANETEEINIPEETESTPENADLFESFDSAGEEIDIDIDSISVKTLNTLHPNENLFKQQLLPEQQTIYNKAKAALVNKNKNSFTYTSSRLSAYDICNPIGALINTYPHKFDYWDRGSDKALMYYYKYSRGSKKYSIKAVLKKSKYYSKSLEANAKKKVDSLVDAAYAYASANYPNDPSYGICMYFNNWLCDNNYYNMNGTYENMMSTEVYYLCHSCYGTLLNGYGVCESYALAMSRLLDAAGIRNLYVTGDTAGGGHAWNYVQMPDGKWYLMDSTWNDNPGQRTTYFLSKNQKDRLATGQAFVGAKIFSYEPLSTTNYAPISENDKIVLDKSLVVMKSKKKQQLRVSSGAASGYYDKFQFKYEWSSDKTSVAKVDKKGKVTAGQPGQANITVKLGSISKKCTVCVYQITKLAFENNKPSFTRETTAGASISIPITVQQKDKTLTAASIASYTGILPTVKSNKSSVADASVSLSGDTIILQVVPKSSGTAKITVKFDGKTAKCTVKVK